MFNFKSLVFLSMYAAWWPAWVQPASASTLILPRPVFEKSNGDNTPLARKDEPLRLSLPEHAGGPIDEGEKLLRRRAIRLGYSLDSGESGPAPITLSRCEPTTIGELLKRHGIEQPLEPDRARQAYHLVAEATSGGKSRVTLQAADDWGLYYGIVSLCQLLEVDDAGALIIPAVEILDYPEIAHRLLKTSGVYPAAYLERLTPLLSLLKISQIGLQYHGKNSKDPGPVFTANIKTICSRLRRQGTLESIVYFCPFRGEGPKGSDHLKGSYDFSSEADRKTYAEYLLWIMAQGPQGIQVDYNDWPGSKDVPISDVLNLAFQTVRKRYPDAYVLYCPPSKGSETYRGPASPLMRETLTRVPKEIWPLWTGLKTLIEEPLKVEVVEQWTRDAGRRPFLWLNRAGVHVKLSFSHAVLGTQDGRVFAGDLLPRDLNYLFEGVHLNTGLVSTGLIHEGQPEPDNELYSQLDPRERVYLATAADFLWNPKQWEPVDSYRRAVRFVEVIRDLMPEADTRPVGNNPSR